MNTTRRDICGGLLAAGALSTFNIGCAGFGRGRAAQLAGGACFAQHQFAVDHHAAAHTRAEGEHHEILHAACASIDQFTESGSIGIVGDDDRHVDMLVNQIRKVDDPLEIQVGGILDATCIVVAYRRCNTDTVDGVDVVFSHQCLDAVANISDIEFYIKVSVGVDVFLG